MADGERAKLFLRFFRADSARHSKGTGLGLALVSAIAELHDMRVEAANNGPGLRISLSSGRLGANDEGLVRAHGLWRLISMRRELTDRPLANSTPNDRWAAQHDRLRIQPKVLLELMGRYQYQLKFVIEKPGDMDEVRALIGALEADRSRVILMPEGTDRDRLRERAVWLAEICKREGFRFSPRLHVDLWGHRRGV